MTNTALQTSTTARNPYLAYPVFAPVGRVAAAPYDEALARSRGESASPPALETPSPGHLPPDIPLEGFDDDNLSRTIDDSIPF